jgi:predicted transcriptional regulator
MEDTLDIIGSPARWRIMERLSRGPCELKQLARELEMTVQGVSKHMEILSKAGIVSQEKREDRRTVYTLIRRVWLDRQSGKDFEMIGFFQSAKGPSERYLNPEIRFRARRYMKRLAKFLDSSWV